MVKRIRLKPKFEYLPRDPNRIKHRLIAYRRLTTRLGLEGASPRKKKTVLSGAKVLVNHFWRLELSRQQVDQVEQTIHAFLNQRPRLKAEWQAFEASGGGTVEELKEWLRKAAEHSAAPIPGYGYLAWLKPLNTLPI